MSSFHMVEKIRALDLATGESGIGVRGLRVNPDFYHYLLPTLDSKIIIRSEMCKENLMTLQCLQNLLATTISFDFVLHF